MVEIKANNLTSVGGQKVRLDVTEAFEPQVDDWQKFYAHIQETGEFELLYRRMNPASVKERWENDIAIPGVVKFPITKLSKHEVK